MALGEKPVAEAVQAATRRVAYRVKNRTIKRLDSHFTVRRKAFIVKGIRVKQPPRGTRLRDVYAEIGTIDRFMADHDSEAKTERRPVHAQRRWIPLAARPYAQAETPVNKWPGNELRKSAKPKAFATIAREHSKAVIGRRRGKGRYPVKWLWAQTFDFKQLIPDDWPFEPESVAEIDASLLDRLEWELDKLVRKAGWR